LRFFFSPSAGAGAAALLAVFLAALAPAGALDAVDAGAFAAEAGYEICVNTNIYDLARP